MKAIVIGAGLGGLAMAVSLAKKGHQVKIFERRAELWTFGGFINLSTSATTSFAYIGLEDQINAISDKTNSVRQRDLVTGEVFRALPLPTNSRGLFRTTLRSILLKMLYEEAVRLGVTVKFSSTVIDVAETADAAFVILDTGSKEQADLILGADGIKSRMRAKVLGSYVSDLAELEPETTERTIYVVKVSPEVVRSYGSDAELLHPNSVSFWAGQDGRYVISIYQTGLDAFTLACHLREPTDMKTLFDDAGDIEYLRKRFAPQTHPEIQYVLDAAKNCERWQIAQMNDLPRWRSSHGRIVLIGDAAHAMHPTGGVGFSSMMEEAAVLAYILEQNGTDDVAEATRLWEEICKPRSDRLRAYSAFLSDQYEVNYEELKQGAAQEAEMLKTDPDLADVKADMNAYFTKPEFAVYYLKHDPITHAREYLDKQARRPDSRTA